MNISSKQLWSRLQQIGSYLLIVVFMSISAGQLFHIHSDMRPDQEATSGENERIQLADKCAVCDYYHHIQGQQIILLQLQIAIIPSPEVITLNTPVLTGSYDYTPQVIANKGPPH